MPADVLGRCGDQLGTSLAVLQPGLRGLHLLDCPPYLGAVLEPVLLRLCGAGGVSKTSEVGGGHAGALSLVAARGQCDLDLAVAPP